MNPKHLSVRMDRSTGEIWLTEEKYSQSPKRIKMITSDVILALAADIVAVDDTRSAVRDLKFSDGAHIRLLVQDLTKGDPEKEHNALRAAAQHVLDNWEHGNLAMAVRQLESVMNKTKEKEID